MFTLNRYTFRLFRSFAEQGLKGLKLQVMNSRVTMTPRGRQAMGKTRGYKILRESKQRVLYAAT
jgi:hypothetical protein